MSFLRLGSPDPQTDADTAAGLIVDACGAASHGIACLRGFVDSP